MFKNIVKIGLAIYSICQMAKFARPKLIASDVSVKTFAQFGEVLPVDGEIFMYFTGVVEAFVYNTSAPLLKLPEVAL